MLNIKHRTAHNIYYGIENNTGKIMHISEVPSGNACNCHCAACENPLVAKKGNKRTPHFAHEANNDCIYSNEIGIYKIFSEVLSNYKELMLPPAYIRFPLWAKQELCFDRHPLNFDSVDLNYDPHNYPPSLKVNYKKYALQVLLNFNHDLDKSHFELEEYAKANSISLLMYHVPDPKHYSAFASKQLYNRIRQATEAEWIYSCRAEQEKEKYHQHAVVPDFCGNGYACPLSKYYENGIFFARSEDCAHCDYNIAATKDRCLCMAYSGIHSKEDFSCAPDKLHARIEKERSKNEKKSKHMEVERERQSSLSKNKAGVSYNLHSQKSDPLLIETESIHKQLQAHPHSIVTDQHNCSWFHCSFCNKDKTTDNINPYIRGRRICWDCSLKYKP